jgi:Phage tail-collar fibre protein
MTTYTAVLTLIGQQRVAALIANAGAMVIDGVACGDGAGAPITPVETMTGLVRELWRGQPISVGRDPASPTQVLVSFTIPASVAPATIRELALYAGADCLAVANYPATDLAVGSQGMVNTIDCVMPMAIDTAANVVLQYNPAVLVPIGQLLRAPFIGIDAVLNAPPVASPELGALFVVGPEPLGLWSHHAHEFAQFDGMAYRYAKAPLRTIVGNAADGYDYRRTATGWARIRIGDPGLENVGSAAAVALYVGDGEEGVHQLAKLSGATPRVAMC